MVICPKCGEGFTFGGTRLTMYRDICPHCERQIVKLQCYGCDETYYTYYSKGVCVGNHQCGSRARNRDRVYDTEERATQTRTEGQRISEGFRILNQGDD